MSGGPSEAIVAIREAVDAGAALARRAFADRSFEVTLKADGTPVTSVDVEVQRCVSEHLRDRLGDVAIAGEESGAKPRTRPDSYIAIDPIDGTSNFIRGVPFFAVTAVLVESGRATAGVVADPVHGSTLWAVRGAGAQSDGEPLRVPPGPDGLVGSTVSLLSESLPDRLRTTFLAEVAARVDRHLALRAIALEVSGVALGWMDAAVLNGAAVWDIGAASLVLEEAGGHWTDLDGERPSFADPTGRYSFCGAVNARIHAELLALAGAGRTGGGR